MKLETLTKLAEARRKIDTRLKAEAAAEKERIQPLKDKMNLIDDRLGAVINKSKGKGTMKSFKLPDGVLVYASEVDKYSTKDRNDLDSWVIHPLSLYLDIEEDLLGEKEFKEQFEDLIKAIDQVKDRLGIFSNAIVKDSAIAYRKDTGASEVEGDLTGGKLPGGIGMFKDRKVNFRKG